MDFGGVKEDGISQGTCPLSSSLLEQRSDFICLCKYKVFFSSILEDSIKDV